MATHSAAGSGDRHPWVAALLSTLFPGLGQMYAGAMRRGGWLLVVDAVLLGGVYLGLQNRLELIKAWVRPGGLALFMLGNVLLLGFRAWAAADAAVMARGGPARSPTPVGLFTAAGVAALVLAPHAVFGYYDLVQFNFISTTFQEDDVAAGTATTSPPGGEEPVEGATPATTVAVDAPPALWDGLSRLNLLLMGGDAGPDRRAVRTDTMIVASIDPQTGDAAIFGVPRNWANVPLPAGSGVWECNCFPRLLNDLYYAGEVEYPGSFPGPGSPGENAIKGGVAELLDIPIHYYALVDLAGFVGIVDALGGVEIDVPFRILDEVYPHENGVDIEHIDIAPGVQTLDGHLALAYARIRRHADDYARMSRQRCVLDAVMAQSSPVELAAAYTGILGVLKDSLQTDIPISRLDDFVDLIPLIDTENIITLRLIPPDYLAGFTASGNNLPDVDLIQRDVRTVMEMSPADAIATLGLQTLEDACE
ncbi:MAG: LCP family protein [Acidimicrobiia bacterium]